MNQIWIKYESNVNQILESYMVFGIKNSSWVIKKMLKLSWIQSIQSEFRVYCFVNIQTESKKSNQSLNNLVRSSKLDP